MLFFLDAILYRLSNPSVGSRSTLKFKETELKEVDQEYRKRKNRWLVSLTRRVMSPQSHSTIMVFLGLLHIIDS